MKSNFLLELLIVKNLKRLRLKFQLTKHSQHIDLDFLMQNESLEKALL